MKQEKCKSSEGKCGNVSKIIASSSPEGWMSRSGEEVALGAGDNSEGETTLPKSKNIRELLAFVLWFSFYLCTLFVIVFVYCMAFAVHWWWLFDNEWGSAEDSHGRLSREHQSITPGAPAWIITQQLYKEKHTAHLLLHSSALLCHTALMHQL